MSLENELQRWIVENTKILSEGHVKNVPSISSLSQLINKETAPLWKYIISNVRLYHKAEHIRKVLRARCAQNDLYNLYPPARKDILAAKQELGDAEEKLKFNKQSYKRNENSVSELQEEIRNVKRSNCILMQKISMTNLVVFGYEQKQESLHLYLEKLASLMGDLFSVDKTKYIQNALAINSLNSIENKNVDLKLIDTRLKSVIRQISSGFRLELSSNEKNALFNSCHEHITELVSTSTANDVIVILKELSKQSEDQLKQEFFFSHSTSTVKNKRQRLSDSHLQRIKRNLICSRFNVVKVKDAAELLEDCKIKFSNEKCSVNHNELCQSVLNLTAENECFKSSIEYMEKSLAIELDTIKCLTDENNAKRAHNKHMVTSMQTFNQKLEFIHILLQTKPRIFSNITKVIISSRNLLHNFEETIRGEELFSDFIKEGDSVFEISLELLKTKSILKCLLYNNDSERASIPQEVLEFLDVEVFQNDNKFYENLVRTKKIVTSPISHSIRDYETDDSVNELKSWTNNILSKSEEMTSAETDIAALIQDNCGNLKLALKEWWDQDAQFIPSIEYENKSLQMWLAILYVLKDF